MNARKKRHFKNSLKLAPYVITLMLAGGYTLVDNISDMKVEKQIENIKEYVTEESEVPIVEEKPEEEIEVETTEPIKIREEKISSDLLESGYEFEDIDFDQLKQINKDSTAWLIIDGTKIDLPVVKSDDNEYYLHHDIEGNDSKYGTLFTDYRNTPLDSDTLDNITFIYGHHMKGGKMLAQICNYKDQTFYDEHKFGIVYTPDGYAYKASVVASIVVDGNDESEIYRNNFDTTKDLINYMKKIKDMSLIESDETIDFDSKYLALVTCSYETTNSRCIVFLKLEKEYTKENQLGNNVGYTLK